MISFDEARQKILAECSKTEVEKLALADVLGRVLAIDIISDENLPPFDNSAMDGFAFDTAGKGLSAGAEFNVIGSQAAGDNQENFEQGACEIMTGACMPKGFDTVVPIEQISVLERSASERPLRIRVDATAMLGAHIRRCGQDVAAGQQVLRAGTRIDPAVRMVLAALGVSPVLVYSNVQAALLTTGRELVDDPNQALQLGQIRNSNGPFLSDRLRESGAFICHQETVPDDANAFCEALTRSLQAGANLVISTGAVSMGRYDFVPDALRSIGAEILFHKVAMRPGKPLLFAVLPNGSLYFGLPGNPVSSAVGFRFFVEPALRAMLGMSVENNMRFALSDSLEKKSGFVYLQKARVGFNQHHQLEVTVLNGQQSFRIQPLLEANAWVVLPAEPSAFVKGEMVDVLGLDGRGIVFNSAGINDGN